MKYNDNSLCSVTSLVVYRCVICISRCSVVIFKVLFHETTIRTTNLSFHKHLIVFLNHYFYYSLRFFSTVAKILPRVIKIGLMITHLLPRICCLHPGVHEYIEHRKRRADMTRTGQISKRKKTQKKPSRHRM